MKLHKVYCFTKFILFLIMGILVLVFSSPIMNQDGAVLNGVVGIVIAIYGLEGVIMPIATKSVKQRKIELLNGGINIVIALVMIFLLEGNPEELRIVCVLWSVWSIMREGEEIIEKGFEGFREHPNVSLVNFAESIVVIVFSILLICAKDYHSLVHHAHAHVILLGIELIIEVIWVYAAKLESRTLRRLKEKRSKEVK